MDALPPGITWLVPPFLASVRSLRVGCSMSRNTTFGFRILGAILYHCPRLSCLEIHSKQEHSSKAQRKDPRDICKLIEGLTSSAPQSLSELRLNNMLFLLRSHAVFLWELAAALPNLAKVAITIDQDLQKLGWKSTDYGISGVPAHSNDLMKRLLAEATRTAWQYMQGLRELSKRFEIASLEGECTQAVDSSLFFFIHSPKSLETTEARVELLRWFQQYFEWLPTFNWRTHWTNYPESCSRYTLMNMGRRALEEIKQAGIPVQLAISTKYQWDHERKMEQDYGSFYTAVWKQGCPDEACYQRGQWLRGCAQGSGNYCIDDVGDLIDYLNICCQYFLLLIFSRIRIFLKGLHHLFVYRP